MDRANSPWTAETATRAMEAARELERMDVFEEMAALHDGEPVPMFRTQLSLRYREIVGVHPDDRQEYRESLMRIAEGGGTAVIDLKAQFSRR